jgi:cold shock CspA family protein
MDDSTKLKGHVLRFDKVRGAGWLQDEAGNVYKVWLTEGSALEPGQAVEFVAGGDGKAVIEPIRSEAMKRLIRGPC